MYLICDIIKEMLNNNAYFEGSTTQHSIKSIKGYQLIDHSYDILKNNSEMFLSDVISNLRRAINYRISTLFYNLGIDNLKFKNLGNKKKLEKLEQLNIVKPLLLNKLISIRNGIEYNGASPPSQGECEELIDIVWYFYKSTDRYCNIEPDSFIIEFEQKNFLELEFDFKQHKILKIRGRTNPSYLSEEKKGDSILLHDIEIKYIPSETNIKETDVYFTGVIYTNELKPYLGIFSLVLTEWGNF